MHYLDEVDGISVAHNFAGGRNDGNSKYGFDKSDAEDFGKSERLGFKSDVSSKCEAKKTDSALLCGSPSIRGSGRLLLDMRTRCF